MDRAYAVERVFQAVVTVWAVVTLSFALIQFLPGGPNSLQAATASIDAGGGAVDVGGSERLLDPSEPLYAQYVDYLLALAQGDFGTSQFFRVPVTEILGTALPWTVFLYTTALVLLFSIGTVLGAVLAYREGTRFDTLVSSLATFLNATPYYVAAVVMLYLLGYQFSLFPVSGKVDPSIAPGFHPAYLLSILHHAALPILSIVMTGFGFRALAMRGNSLSVLGEDYVRVADLRGLPDRRIAFQYVGRNAVLPMYTGMLISIGFLFGGSVVIERIFQYKGIGFFLFRAIASRDYPLMMAAFLFITLSVVVGLLLADLTYGFIDPRAATKRSAGSDFLTAARTARRRLRAAGPWLLRTVARLYVRLSPYRTYDSAVAASPASASDQGSVFETTADTTGTRRERYEQLFDEVVRAPARIMWADPRTRLGTVILGAFVVSATVLVHLVPAPQPNQGPRLVGAGYLVAHPLGTTATGQDLLSLVVHSTPPMLKMILSGAIFATVMATGVGLLAGYLGGATDRVLTAVTDVAMTIPGLPLVMVLAVLFNPTDPYTLGIMLTINAWGGTARQIRSEVLTIAEKSYVEASSLMALPLRTILTKDILPNIAPFVFIKFVQAARGVIVVSVALYFLGVLSFQSNNWGVILRLAYENGALYTMDAAHWIFVPIVCIVALTYGMILFAQGTDRIFNPRLRAKHAAGTETDRSAADRDVAPGGD